MVQDAGFEALKWCEVGKSEHAALCGVEGHWRTMPAEFNLLETMVLEATKPKFVPSSAGRCSAMAAKGTVHLSHPFRGTK